MASVGPSFETIHGIGQTRRSFGQVRCVYLRQIAHTNDLGAWPGARDQCLHLLGGEILGLVNDHILVHERASAHEVHAFDLDSAPD